MVCLPAGAAEVLFKGTGINIPQSFLCGGTTRPAGRYDLEVQYDPKPADKSALRISKENQSLCELPGSSTSTYNSLATNKVRLFTKVNSEMQAIQVDIVLPAGVRSRVSNQVFYVPLAAKN